MGSYSVDDLKSGRLQVLIPGYEHVADELMAHITGYDHARGMTAMAYVNMPLRCRGRSFPLELAPGDGVISPNGAIVRSKYFLLFRSQPALEFWVEEQNGS